MSILDRFLQRGPPAPAAAPPVGRSRREHRPVRAPMLPVGTRPIVSVHEDVCYELGRVHDVLAEIRDLLEEIRDGLAGRG